LRDHSSSHYLKANPVARTKLITRYTFVGLVVGAGNNSGTHWRTLEVGTEERVRLVEEKKMLRRYF